ncbi:hypothetical protein [Streptomyces sp. NPDC002785]|uniref:hypothetical protein n=1 Tax=Streptomyces sp. NPDC002785 TaxID=3154543 RepID=UPI00331FFAFA
MTEAHSLTKGYQSGSIKPRTMRCATIALLATAAAVGSTGSTRATPTAVPRRLPVPAAKAAVFTDVVLASMTVACVATLVGGQAVLSSPHLTTHLTDTGVAPAIFRTALCFTAVGLLARVYARRGAPPFRVPGIDPRRRTAAPGRAQRQPRE